MGTRNVIAVMIDGEYKVAQYSQWDGYPSGQGLTALRFLRSADLDKLADAVRHCSWITEEEREEAWIQCGAERGAMTVSFDISGKFRDVFPELSRDTGARILRLICDHPTGLKLANYIDFVYDAVFCEYVWVVDLDKRTFEGYKGFNQSPIEEESARFQKEPYVSRSGKTFYPPALMKSYNLDNLPTEEQFLVDLNSTEDEDEE